MSWSINQEVENTFIVVFTILAVVDIVGNALVILVVQRFTNMQTPNNYLLVHLAICDVLFGVFVLLFRFLNGVYEHPKGIGGDLLCKLFTTGTLAWLPACASVYTLVAIAWERYNAIMKPHAPRFSKRKLKIVVALCWLGSAVINIPQKISYVYDPNLKTCAHHIPWMEKLDSMVWLLCVGTLPIVIMTVLYGRVIFSLWGISNSPDNVAQRSLIQSRKRITKSGITVTVFFMVCWMPNLLSYTVITHKDLPYVASKENSVVLWRHSTIFLLLLNSSLNPFIYELPDKRFRRCLRDLFKCVCKRRRPNRIHLDSNEEIKMKNIRREGMTKRTE